MCGCCDRRCAALPRNELWPRSFRPSGAATLPFSVAGTKLCSPPWFSLWHNLFARPRLPQRPISPPIYILAPCPSLCGIYIYINTILRVRIAFLVYESTRHLPSRSVFLPITWKRNYGSLEISPFHLWQCIAVLQTSYSISKELHFGIAWLKMELHVSHLWQLEETC